MSIRCSATRRTYLEGICSAGTPTDLTLQRVALTQDKEPFSLAPHQQKPPSCLQGNCKNLFCIIKERVLGFFLNVNITLGGSIDPSAAFPAPGWRFAARPAVGGSDKVLQPHSLRAIHHRAPHAAAPAPPPPGGDKGLARGPASLGDVLFVLN